MYNKANVLPNVTRPHLQRSFIIHWNPKYPTGRILFFTHDLIIQGRLQLDPLCPHISVLVLSMWIGYCIAEF